MVSFGFCTGYIGIEGLKGFEVLWILHVGVPGYKSRPFDYCMPGSAIFKA